MEGMTLNQFLRELATLNVNHVSVSKELASFKAAIYFRNEAGKYIALKIDPNDGVLESFSNIPILDLINRIDKEFEQSGSEELLYGEWLKIKSGLLKK